MASPQKDNAKGRGPVQTKKRPRRGTKITGGIYIPSRHEHLAPHIDAWIRQYDTVADFLAALWKEKHQ